ncbi:MAG: MBL fold metallo-hydrolase [Nanoarchaeota archaeon]
MKIGNINLEWKGHSGFLINNEKTVYIDPYKLSAGAEKADIILITHGHYDHCSIEDLQRIVKDGTVVVCPADCQSKLTKLREKINIKVIEVGGEMEIEGIRIRAVPSYNIRKEFHSRAEYWNGYIVDISGLRIYHAGDTDLIPEMSSMNRIDIALLPVGGTYTMTAEEAAKAAFMIKPKIAIPMHYGDVVGTREDAERFVELCEGEGIKAEVMEKK